MLMPVHIRKKDGRLDEFNPEKIKRAIRNVTIEINLKNPDEITEEIFTEVKKKIGFGLNGNIPNIEDVKKIVISASEEIGYSEVSRAYQNFKKPEKKVYAVIENKNSNTSTNTISLSEMPNNKGALNIDRYFTDEENYIPIQWDKTNIEITDEMGKLLFVQKDAEFPKYFSLLARKIIASRYFYGEAGTDEREYSFKQLVKRVTQTFAKWGIKQKYLTEKDAKTFEEELAYLTLTQRMSFNSPVWFNVGTDKFDSEKTNEKKAGFIIKNGQIIEIPIGEYHLYPQTSACFIQSVDDTMEGIMDLAKNEAMLFKHGSGTGTDLSTLRSSKEKLSGGGKPSGPLQYLTFYDRVAGIVKSGGKTRRAAKMNSLKIIHPDIKEFILSKTKEQKKIELLMDNGIDGREAIDTVAFQNANLSVRLTDEFMKAVENDAEWQTIPIHNKDMADQMPKYNARELFRLIAEGTHVCGDPGVQYDTTMNNWNTCPNSGRINASNPCSEYCFLDNSSCNLASLNLRSFMNMDGSFNVEDFEKTARITAIAQDLEIDNSSFPTKSIAENSHKFRPLGMGYANLGSLVMSLGFPYDSDESRAIAASITALMTAKVYETSTELAEKIGTFEEYKKNEEPMLKIIRKHISALKDINKDKLPKGFKQILERAETIWGRVLIRGEKYGFRNSQATVLAPTGTIGFMMDCDTKGIEPEIGLVQTKLLAEGGILKMVNGTVKFALEKLGYSKEQINRIMKYIEENETIEGSEIKEEHLPIFDCSNKPPQGKRVISTMGHIRMMAAVQPFLSGAISKTVNMPNEASVEDIEEIYMQSWKLGLKAVAIYRDGSKRMQPLSFTQKKQGKIGEPYRKRLPLTRPSITHKFNIAGHEGYLIAGLYEDGQPGELFINMSKEGSTVGGLMGSLGTLTSISLQYGVPLKTIINKFKSQRFEPLGIVLEGREDIKAATSIVDYIGQYLEKQFLLKQKKEDKPKIQEQIKINLEEIEEIIIEEFGKFCPSCGGRMVKKGHCAEYCKCGYIDLTGCGG